MPMKFAIARGALILGAIAAGSATALARETPQPPAALRWQLDRVVLVMRHGVRPPTKPEPLPRTIVTAPWPAWDVGWGELTHHGARAVGVLGDIDRARYRGLLGQDCPPVRAVADSDERTVQTAAVYLAHLLPGCTVAVEHGAQGQADPRFSPFAGASSLAQDSTLAAAQAALPDGGLAALDQQFAGQWQEIDAITGCREATCSITIKPTALAAPGGRAKLSGALRLGASFAQTLALEYADGKPLAEVGWGRATLDRISHLSALHAAEFAITARPCLLAQAGAKALLADLRASLTQTAGPRFIVYVGHDSNLSWLGGALGLHWQVPQFAADDPPPGGALVFERWTNGSGRYRVRVLFRSQSLDDMRNLGTVARPYLPTTGNIACAEPRQCTLAMLARAFEPR